MKIRTQLRFFIIGIVILQAIGILILPIYKSFIEPAEPSKTALNVTYFFIFLVEFFCIFFAIHISASIVKSITFLQRSTKNLAEGKINTSLERRKNRRGENEITDLIVSLEKMRLTLVEESERSKKFIMGISHDLRTPVAVIRGYAEAIADGMMSTPDDISKSVKLMLTKVEQLEVMINTLINFIRLESTDWKNILIKQPIAPVLKDFLNTSIETGKLSNRNVSGSIELSDDSQVAFEKELFLRMMENLFSNAVRYTKENGSITINAKEDDNEITLTIIDTGIGIDQKDIKFIFDIFYRATNSRQEEGFGIGLSVVKNIIDIHGWAIDVDSEKDVGTTFTIKIPKNSSKA